MKACENTVLSITCNSNEYIKIKTANYGRTDPSTCSTCSTSPNLCTLTTCVSNRYSYVSSACDSKTSCTVSVSNSGFEDPCQGTLKYLDVYYECISSTTQQSGKKNKNILNFVL